MKMLSLNVRGEVAAEQVSLILGKNFVLSLREQNSDIFDPMVERIKSGKGSSAWLGACRPYDESAANPPGRIFASIPISPAGS